MQPTTATDGNLLRKWADRRDDPAFEEIVSRHLGFVQRTAKRICGNDAMAAEAAQLTFIVLARKAASISRHPSIAGWLHVTAVMQTRNLMRQRQREYRKHEHFERTMDDPSENDPGGIWNDLEPHLDAAISGLSATDREALLLRYYRTLSVKEVASVLGIATSAAQKRLDRAMDRLRSKLAHLGHARCALLGAAMESGLRNPSGAIPASAVRIISAKATAAGTSLATGTLVGTTLTLMTKKTSIVIASLLLCAGGGYIIVNSGGGEKPGPSRVAGGTDLPPATTRGNSPPSAPMFRRSERKQDTDAELAAKYGEARTRQAIRLAANTLGQQQDILKLLDLSMSVAANNPAARLQVRKSILESNLSILGKLGIRGDQEEQILGIGDQALARMTGELSAVNSSLEENPRPLAEYYLAGDAYRRNEISAGEYNRIVIAKDREMGGELGKIVFGSDQGFLEDEKFRRDMLEVLDAGQAAIFQEAAEEHAAEILRKNANPAASAKEMAKCEEEIAASRKLFGNMIDMFESIKAKPGSSSKQ